MTVNTFTTTAGKIHSRDLLRRQTEIWRAQGLTMVMTNGCFDLLHAGHIATLETARSLGNVLIVAINSDQSVKRLKGNDRPLNNENDRARVLAALACVDAVTVFAEETADSLLETLRPDVYVKGGDYNADTLPERGIVERYGGRMVFCQLLEGHSTTSLIDACRK